MPLISDINLSALISIADDETALRVVELLPSEELVAILLDPENESGRPTLLHTVAAKMPKKIEYIYYILRCFQQAAIAPAVIEEKVLPHEQKEPSRILDSIVNLRYPYKPKRSQNLLYLFASNSHMTPILWKLLHSLISQPALELAWNDNFHEESTSESSFIKEAARHQSPECLEVIINAQINQQSYDDAMLKRAYNYEDYLNIPFVLAAKDVRKFTLLVERASSKALNLALLSKGNCMTVDSFVRCLSEETFDVIFKKTPYEKWVEALKPVETFYHEKSKTSYECTELLRVFRDDKKKMFKTLINALTQQDLNDNFELNLHEHGVSHVMAKHDVSDTDLPDYAEIISYLEKKLYPRLLVKEDLHCWSEYFSIGYEFCPEPEEESDEEFKVEPNKIYVKQTNAVMTYTVMNPLGERVTGSIDDIELGNEIPEPFTVPALTPYFPRILEITTARTHTVESEKVAFIRRYSQMKEVLLRPEKTMSSTPNEFINFFREHVSQAETIVDFPYWETTLKTNIKLANEKKLNQVRDALLIVLAHGYFTMHFSSESSSTYYIQAHQTLLAIDTPMYLNPEDNQFIGDELTAIGFENSNGVMEQKEQCTPIERMQFATTRKTYPEIYQQGLCHLRVAEISQQKTAKQLLSLRSISMFGLSEADRISAYAASLANKMVVADQAKGNLDALGWKSFCVLLQVEYDKLNSSKETAFFQEILRLKLLFEMANSTNRIDISRKILFLLQEENRKINSPVNKTSPTLFQATENIYEHKREDAQDKVSLSYGRWAGKMLEIMEKINSKINEQAQHSNHRAANTTPNIK
ncbi:MAG: hypothetical protein ABI597_10860 [Gammaproteobacteria bacterium]